MDDTRTQATEGGTNMAERYTGPSARRIADLLPHRVSFERGWFWTTTAICHGGRSDGLAFRQRPDGEGIDVRCHTGGCSKGVVITEMEALIGLPIWTAYEAVADSADKAPEKRPWWKRKKVVVAGVVALVVAAPLLTLDVELFFLNLVGLGIGCAAAQAVPRAAHGAEVPALTGRGLSLHSQPTQRKGSSPSGGGPSSLPASGRTDSRQHKADALRRCVMTTATLVVGNRTMDTEDRPRRSLEELVDRLFEALFATDAETEIRSSRARRARSTRRGGSGRRGTWTAGWRSSPAWT